MWSWNTRLVWSCDHAASIRQPTRMTYGPDFDGFLGAGDLFELLTKDTKLPEQVVQTIAKQLVQALHYLHRYGQIWRLLNSLLSPPSSGG